jgi:hypothetical protein
MPRWYSSFPTQPNFHPEFGYLCPPGLVRRKIRRVAVTALAGIAIAGSTMLALALVPRPAVEEAHHDVTALPAAFRSLPSDEATRVALPSLLAATGFSGPPRPQAACGALSNSFLHPECRAGRTGKAHVAHSARRLAAGTIGRTHAESNDANSGLEIDRKPQPEPKPHKIAEGAAQAAGPSVASPAVSADKPTNLSGAVPAKTAAKPGAKPARNPDHGPGPEPADVNRAAAPPPASSRPGNSGGPVFPRLVLPSGFGGAGFARSW